MESKNLCGRFASRAYDVADDPTKADVSVVSDSTLVNDRTILVVSDEADVLTETPAFEYTDLPKRESWNLCSYFVYQDLLDDVDEIPEWVFEDIYPYNYVSNGDSSDSLSIEYTEGWIQDSGAVTLTRD